MNKLKNLNIAIAGLGTVGSNVVDSIINIKIEWNLQVLFKIIVFN